MIGPDDIVERLREWVRTFTCPTTRADLTEAAAEIERLRAMLKNLNAQNMILAEEASRSFEGGYLSGERAAEDRIKSFATAILHGDDEHRRWLMEAAEAFVTGQPMPAVRPARAAEEKKKL